MVFIFSGIRIESKLTHELKTLLSNVVKCLGSLTERKDVQPWKAYYSIDDTLSGMTMDSKLEQFPNAHLPIVLKLFGKITEFSF